MQQIDNFEGNRDSGKERGRKCKPNLTIASYDGYDDRDSGRGRGYGIMRRHQDRGKERKRSKGEGRTRDSKSRRCGSVGAKPKYYHAIVSGIIPAVLPPDVYRIGTFFLPFSTVNVLYHVYSGVSVKIGKINTLVMQGW